VLSLAHAPRRSHAHTHPLSAAPDPTAAPNPTKANEWDRPVSEDEDHKPPVREEGKAKGQPNEEKMKEGPAHGGEGAGLRRIQAEPDREPSQPAARAGLLSRRPS
jgi:hypothetical protein